LKISFSQKVLCEKSLPAPICNPLWASLRNDKE